MLDSTSLIVTTDCSLVALLRKQLRRQKVAESRMIVSATAGEACSLLQCLRARLVVVHLEPERLGCDEVDHILWVASTLPWRVPLVVVAERFLVEQATMLYRMGVSDYLSRSHHLDQLVRLWHRTSRTHPRGLPGLKKSFPGKSRPEWRVRENPLPPSGLVPSDLTAAQLPLGLAIVAPGLVCGGPESAVAGRSIPRRARPVRTSSSLCRYLA